jgi:putative membrane protein
VIPESLILQSFETRNALSASKRILVLNVDRDDDIGVKAGLETPIVGREKCLEAGMKLLLADPEEADANAIYAAISEYDRLKKKGYDCEIAILSGSKEGGFEADQKMLKQAKAVASTMNAEGIVLVSDGLEDEKVIPILNNVAPILSTKRIVIRHSASVEESYEVLGRYLKMLIYESKYSRYVLGIPGILLVLYGIFASLQLYEYFLFIFAFVVGGIFVVRGFGLDNMLSQARRRTFFMARFFAFLASVIIGIVAIVQGYNAMSSLAQWKLLSLNPSFVYQYLGLFAGTFIQSSAILFWVAIAVNIVVDAVYHGMQRSTKVARDMIALAALVLMYTPVLALAALFENPKGSAVPIVSLLLAGLAVVLVLVYLFYQVVQSRRVSAHEKE